VRVNTYDLVALSADGKRKGERRDVVAVAGAVNTVNLTLQARATVTGRVETSTGLPVANALVGGGEALVHTNASGLFTLTGVPTGQRTIAAALERDEQAGIEFPRTGIASVNVVPGADNFVMRLTQLDAFSVGAGRRWTPGAECGCRDSADGDSRGSMRMHRATSSLSASPSANTTSVRPRRTKIRLMARPRRDRLRTRARMKSSQLSARRSPFTGVNNPLLNGEGANFTRSTGLHEGRD
jgi:hypothetical protein